MSFFAVSNGKTLFTGGQLAWSLVNDLSFQSFSNLKTIKTLINLYRTRSLSRQPIRLHFNQGVIYDTETDDYGAFQLTTPETHEALVLESITLPNAVRVIPVGHLYACHVQYVYTPHLVVSDIDDTVLHSFIRHKVKKLRKLLFTRMEKRKPVTDMKQLIEGMVAKGATVFYLSNSEQNLYPLIYRFLRHNHFPAGPVMLKHLRKISDLLLNRKTPKGNKHKLDSLAQLLQVFPDKKFILIGDNTQQDLSIYVSVAQQHPAQVDHIVIRKVFPHPTDQQTIRKIDSWLDQHDITLSYAETFDTVEI